jgi:hypothetical protein
MMMFIHQLCLFSFFFHSNQAIKLGTYLAGVARNYHATCCLAAHGLVCNA